MTIDPHFDTASRSGASDRPAPWHGVSRRGVLAASAAGVGALAVAACSGATGNSGSGSGGAGGADGKQAEKAGQTLTALASVQVGGAVSVKLPDGSPGIVSRPAGDTAVCFSAICTHMGCTVAPNGDRLDCPCHGSVYNAMTGAVISGPAPSPLPAIAVHVADGNVVTGTAAP